MSIAATLVGAVVAAGIAWAARRAGSLDDSGAATAVALGTLATAVHPAWAALLVAYFVSSAALSRAGAARKAARTAGIVAKGGARDAVQVLANGGVFGLLALAMLLAPQPRLAVAAAAALAASAADTWATEVGTWWGGTPRHVLTGARLAPGMSGGVTVAGSLGMLAGAAGVAGVAALFGWPSGTLVAVGLGGVAGAMADSVLGATVQERRTCPACATATEQPVHTCGTATRVVSGWTGVGNDVVNAAATAVGAACAAAWWSPG